VARGSKTGSANKASSVWIPRRAINGWPARKKNKLAIIPIQLHCLTVRFVMDGLIWPFKNPMVAFTAKRDRGSRHDANIAEKDGRAVWPQDC